MKTFKAVIAGGLMGILATVGGMRLAHADCDRDSYDAAMAQARKCGTATSWAEQTAPGVWAGRCGDNEGNTVQTYAEARIDADACDTNYGEVVRVRGGFEAYCVPDDVAEGCIDVSSLLDCSLVSASACDQAMGSMFEACMTLQAAGGR